MIRIVIWYLEIPLCLKLGWRYLVSSAVTLQILDTFDAYEPRLVETFLIWFLVYRAVIVLKTQFEYELLRCLV